MAPRRCPFPPRNGKDQKVSTPREKVQIYFATEKRNHAAYVGAAASPVHEDRPSLDHLLTGKFVEARKGGKLKFSKHRMAHLVTAHIDVYHSSVSAQETQRKLETGFLGTAANHYSMQSGHIHDVTFASYQPTAMGRQCQSKPLKQPKNKVYHFPALYGSAGGTPQMPSEHRPTLEDVKRWSKSFDCLMNHKVGQQMFADFLKSEFSDENILFWQACEDLKREKSSEKIEEKARIIYEDFVSILSPKEVSLDSRVREIVNNNMARPNAHTFDEAQAQIYTLMQRDSYPRFIGSEFFKQLRCTFAEPD
ncbi:hypothetical protein M513_07340 [Trichuris suis]|uniref:RGS domain-containing protein n=1 Tax=Trichuris suis TaxID=68888 RepID=A0A085M3L7_9BILA|nr:hypothetical protein M513_07340 [Trichuris suis]